MKNGVFWDVMPCGSCKNRCFGGTWRLLHYGDKNSHLVFLCSVSRLLVTASVVPSSPILVTLMKEALSSSETSVLTRGTRSNIPEDSILHECRFPNTKSKTLMINACVPLIQPQVLDFKHYGLNVFYGIPLITIDKNRVNRIS
jgi:hypothetical protein